MWLKQMAAMRYGIKDEPVDAMIYKANKRSSKLLALLHLLVLIRRFLQDT
jgi:hypothetical protein